MFNGQLASDICYVLQLHNPLCMMVRITVKPLAALFRSSSRELVFRAWWVLLGTELAERMDTDIIHYTGTLGRCDSN